MFNLSILLPTTKTFILPQKHFLRMCEREKDKQEIFQMKSRNTIFFFSYTPKTKVHPKQKLEQG